MEMTPIAIVMPGFGISAGIRAWNKVLVTITKNPNLLAEIPAPTTRRAPVLESREILGRLLLLTFCMVPNSQERFELERQLQVLVDGYKIIATLHNSINFHLPADRKEVLLYLQIVQRLKKGHVVGCRQVEAFSWDQDTGNRISQASQPNKCTLPTEPSTFRVRSFSRVTTCAIASTRIPSSLAVLETRSGLLKRLAKKQALCDIWDEFLFGDEGDMSASENKEIGLEGVVRVGR